jgi:hypothetical protein
MEVNNLFHQGQSQPQAAVKVFPGLSSPFEDLEYFFQVLFGDANAGIGEGDSDVVFMVIFPAVNGNRTLFFIVLDAFIRILLKARSKKVRLP